MANRGPSATERVSMFMGAVFLFGLAALFKTGTIFPGILVLIWLTAIPILLVEHGWFGLWIVAQMTIWLIGLPLLFATGAFFPGVLILAGASTLLAAIFHPTDLDQANQRRRMGEKAKRKRDMPLPFGEERPNHYDRYESEDWQPEGDYTSEAGEKRLRSRRQ